MTSSTLNALLASSTNTAWDYISTLFGPTLTAVIGFIVVGGIFALIVYGVGRLFRHK